MVTSGDSLTRLTPIVETWDKLGAQIGCQLWAVREDLLPFPLPGNKVRKLAAELDGLPPEVDTVVTNGAVDSNHCRTLAIMAASRGLRVHLVLHGSAGALSAGQGAALALLEGCGASWDVGPAQSIGDRIQSAVQDLGNRGCQVHVVAGGCHTPQGARATMKAAKAVLAETTVDQIFVASGTGATQGGILAATHSLGLSTQVIGVSVARTSDRGAGPVRDAAAWCGVPNTEPVFVDDYRAGGYGLSNSSIDLAVETGWQLGIPLDPTYTGKAMAALLDYGKKGLLADRVMFWHTGGLWNWISGQLSISGSQS